jgi:hypothetical protein
MFTVNKGRCREESGLQVLEEILNLCDDYKVQLLALWVPRESNLIGDFLSHLCIIVNREEYEGGSLGDLQIFKGQRIESRRQEIHERSETGQPSVSKLVYKPGVEFVPKGVHIRESC